MSQNKSKNYKPTYGVSLSVKQCRNFNIEPISVINWLIKNNFKRFRLMSYWDECESKPGKFNFKDLDKQIKTIQAKGGQITLCVGARQPRWPENHWPDWAWDLEPELRDSYLYRFIEKTINHVKKYKSIVSYQLENEALLKNFGERSDPNPNRLVSEFNLIKSIDDTRPIIMTTSTAFGVPFRVPIPDVVGFSFYRSLFNSKKSAYEKGKQTPFSVKVRAFLVKLMWQKESFIHELQLEPWGPKNIWEMSKKEQNKSMNPRQIKQNLELAHQTKLTTIDLWGSEWWYYKSVIENDDTIINSVKSNLL